MRPCELEEVMDVESVYLSGLLWLQVTKTQLLVLKRTRLDWFSPSTLSLLSLLSSVFASFSDWFSPSWDKETHYGNNPHPGS
jgi:hypothetical protein